MGLTIQILLVYEQLYISRILIYINCKERILLTNNSVWIFGYSNRLWKQKLFQSNTHQLATGMEKASGSWAKIFSFQSNANYKVLQQVDFLSNTLRSKFRKRWIFYGFLKGSVIGPCAVQADGFLGSNWHGRLCISSDSGD